jgi:hypothetical protein
MSRVDLKALDLPQPRKNPTAGASGSQPRSSAGGLRLVIGCLQTHESDEGTGRDRHQEGLIFRGPRLRCGGVDVDLSVQLLLSRVGDVKQVGPGRLPTTRTSMSRGGGPGCPTRFLSCLRRLLCLMSVRRAGEAFAACRIPWPGHGGSRYDRCWPIRCAGPPPGQRAARTPPRVQRPRWRGPGRRRAPVGASRRRGHAAPLTGRGGGPPSRPSAGVR